AITHDEGCRQEADADDAQGHLPPNTVQDRDLDAERPGAAAHDGQDDAGRSRAEQDIVHSASWVSGGGGEAAAYVRGKENRNEAGKLRSTSAQYRPTMSPFSSRSMLMAADLEARPGMVRMSPQIG